MAIKGGIKKVTAPKVPVPKTLSAPRKQGHMTHVVIITLSIFTLGVSLAGFEMSRRALATMNAIQERQGQESARMDLLVASAPLPPYENNSFVADLPEGYGIDVSDTYQDHYMITGKDGVWAELYPVNSTAPASVTTGGDYAIYKTILGGGDTSDWNMEVWHEPSRLAQQQPAIDDMIHVLETNIQFKSRYGEND